MNKDYYANNPIINNRNIGNIIINNAYIGKESTKIREHTIPMQHRVIQQKSKELRFLVSQNVSNGHFHKHHIALSSYELERYSKNK